MAFLIAGHMRSGTSILRTICQTHPRLEVTREFGVFNRLNVSYGSHAVFVMRQWWRRRNRGLLPIGMVGAPTRKLEMLHNLAFVTRYLAQLFRISHGPLTSATVDQALRRMYPHASTVGDKHPDYALRLEDLTADAGIRCVYIYRDPRDVASSTVEKTRGPWRRGHSDELRDPRGIARRWVGMMEAMERCRKRLMAIRYEDFVTDPDPTLSRLGQWLDVEPGGFDRSRIRATSIGKYRQGLTAQELSDVVAVAGATMQRYGYSI